MNPFLDEGLSVYAEAKASIAFFERELVKRLREAAVQRNKMPFLKSHEVIPPEPGGGDGEFWVSMVTKGVSLRSESVDIDCGVWWNSPENKDAIIYASFYTEPKRVLKFSWTNQENGIKSFDRWERTFLYLPGSKVSDVGNSLNNLLDNLLKQLE